MAVSAIVGLVEVPEAVAAELVELGVGRPAPRRRAGVLLETAGVAATVITLVQGPETLVHLARALVTWVRGSAAADDSQVTLSAEGPKGRLELQLDRATDLAAVESLLRTTVFADPE